MNKISNSTIICVGIMCSVSALAGDNPLFRRVIIVPEVVDSLSEGDQGQSNSKPAAAAEEKEDTDARYRESLRQQQEQQRASSSSSSSSSNQSNSSSATNEGSSRPSIGSVAWSLVNKFWGVGSLFGDGSSSKTVSAAQTLKTLDPSSASCDSESNKGQSLEKEGDPVEGRKSSSFKGRRKISPVRYFKVTGKAGVYDKLDQAAILSYSGAISSCLFLGPVNPVTLGLGAGSALWLKGINKNTKCLEDRAALEAEFRKSLVGRVQKQMAEDYLDEKGNPNYDVEEIELDRTMMDTEFGYEYISSISDDPGIFPFIGEKFPNVRKLNLSELAWNYHAPRAESETDQSQLRNIPKSVRSVDLSHNPSSGTAYIPETVEELTLYKMKGKIIPAQIPRYTKVLRIHGNNLEGVDLSSLPNTIETLNMRWTNASREHLSQIQHLTKLRVLNIGGTKITGKDRDLIPAGLHILYVDENQFSDEDRLEILARCPDLTIVDIQK